MNKEIIYIELIDEGTRVFAPVPAEHLGGRYYKILEYERDDIRPCFEAGTFVLCLPTKLEEDEDLISLAYCEVSKEEAEYISGSLNKK